MDSSTERHLRDYFAAHPAFVTGADGFIGSHLVERLLALGARVHAFVRASSSAGLHNLQEASGRDAIRIHRGALEDPVSLEHAIRSAAHDGELAVFHLGAQAHVGESWSRPYETFAANVLGTLNLLHVIAERQIPCSVVDVAGTSEEYGNIDAHFRERYSVQADDLLLNEDSPLAPESPYAVSKVATDQLAQIYHRALRVPAVVVRLFNTFGPRQNPRFVTGTVITQALTRPRVELGNLDARRDFTFVRDSVEAHLLIAARGRPGRVYCVGYGSQVAVGAWAEQILQLGADAGYWPRDRAIVTVPTRLRPGESEIRGLGVDSARVVAETGWRPRHDRATALLETMEWYRRTRDRWQARVDWT